MPPRSAVVKNGRDGSRISSPAREANSTNGRNASELLMISPPFAQKLRVSNRPSGLVSRTPVLLGPNYGVGVSPGSPSFTTHFHLSLAPRSERSSATSVRVRPMARTAGGHKNSRPCRIRGSVP